MPDTLADTIRRLTLEHCESGGIVVGQNLTAVGNVAGTVPEHDNVIELSMADVAGGGIAVGAALARRVIYVVRYQGFLWYNLPSVVNYAAKSKAMWGVPCPILVRAIAMEGGIGPVASGSQHGLALRMPGVAVAAPMTPGGWEGCYRWWQGHDEPMILSEHRWAFGNDQEMMDEWDRSRCGKERVTLIGVGAARFNILKAERVLAEDGILCDRFDMWFLKPSDYHHALKLSLRATKCGLVIDSDAESFGPSQSIAYELMHATGAKVWAMGQEDRVMGFAKQHDHGVPSVERIVAKVKEIVRSK